MRAFKHRVCGILKEASEIPANFEEIAVRRIAPRVV